MTDARRSPAALVRCDGGPRVGIGHLTRSRALAAALEELGWRCAFAVTAETRPFVDGAETREVPPGLEGADAVAVEIGSGRFSALLVDHYGLDAAFERRARGTAAIVAVIDDLADRPHRCDVLLDSNPERAPADYRPLVQPETQLLLGLSYAPLRAEFARYQVEARPARAQPPRLLILLGGADPVRTSERVLEALPRLAPSTVQATLVIGPANPRRETLERLARSVGATAAVAPRDLPRLMLEADLAVATGSTVCLELACLGVPMLLMVAAENQRQLARAAANAGAAELLGDAREVDGRRLAAAIALLAQDGQRRSRMSAAGRSLVDGRGAARAAAFIDGMLRARQPETHP